MMAQPTVATARRSLEAARQAAAAEELELKIETLRKEIRRVKQHDERLREVIGLIGRRALHSIDGRKGPGNAPGYLPVDDSRPSVPLALSKPYLHLDCRFFRTNGVPWTRRRGLGTGSRQELQFDGEHTYLLVDCGIFGCVSLMAKYHLPGKSSTPQLCCC